MIKHSGFIQARGSKGKIVPILSRTYATQRKPLKISSWLVHVDRVCRHSSKYGKFFAAGMNCNHEIAVNKEARMGLAC